MQAKNKTALILSASSDIGIELVKSLKNEGYQIFGTYNNSIPDYDLLPKENWLKLKISDYNSKEYLRWVENIHKWDLFVSCIGSQKPVGKFVEVDTESWVNGVHDNSTYQLGAFLNALPYRDQSVESTGIFFAGGGTNSATPSYSAQTLGKISLIKAVELLDYELFDVKVSILGPGWVGTKIHNATLEEKDKSGENYEKTLFMLNNPEKMNTIEQVINHINIIRKLDKNLVGGRNFSSVHDLITKNNLERLFNEDKDFYKLRRLLNNF